MANNWRISALITVAVALLLSFPVPARCGSPVESHGKKQTFFPGTNQEVAVYSITGAAKGPTLLIVGGIHGDESVCSRVADKYTHLRLKKGSLIIIPRLNKPALAARKRRGLGGDMNRMFGPSEPNRKNPDLRVVNLTKSLIKNADYVVNLHMGGGFYSPTWVNNKRNPKLWGQSNVIDAPFFDLPNGEKLELETLARKVAERANTRIGDKDYHFQVNNTDTANENSIHKDQRKSLTYYALTDQHKMALGLEVTKSCSSPQAYKFLTIALNSMLEETGIIPDRFPSDDMPSTGKSSRKRSRK
jgi:hypothetical protein